MVDSFIFLSEETDRSRILKEKGKYIFNVHQNISKTDVKSWVEQIFKVKVIGINSQHPSKKEKRRGKRIGYPVRYKKIIVSLKQMNIKEKKTVAVIQNSLSKINQSISRPALLPISDQLILANFYDNLLIENSSNPSLSIIKRIN